MAWTEAARHAAAQARKSRSSGRTSAAYRTSLSAKAGRKVSTKSGYGGFRDVGASIYKSKGRSKSSSVQRKSFVASLELRREPKLRRDVNFQFLNRARKGKGGRVSYKTRVAQSRY